MDGKVKPHKLLHAGTIETKHVGKIGTIIQGVISWDILPILVHPSKYKEAVNSHR